MLVGGCGVASMLAITTATFPVAGVPGWLSLSPWPKEGLDCPGLGGGDSNRDSRSVGTSVGARVHSGCSVKAGEKLSRPWKR